MNDFWSETQAHPFIKYLSLFCVKGTPVVEFELAKTDGYIWFERIHSMQEGHGYGSQALDWLCALADKHGVEIRGNIYPPQGGKFTGEQLGAWYQRHGFHVDGVKIQREAKTTAEKKEL